MNPICYFEIKEKNGIDRVMEPVQVGIPFERGVITSVDNLVVKYGASVRACHFEPTASWSDGSVRWATISFLCDIEANGSISVEVLPKQQAHELEECGNLEVDHNDHSLLIRSNDLRFRCSSQSSSLVSVLSGNGDELCSLNLCVTGTDGAIFDTSIDQVVLLNKTSSISSTALIRGQVLNEGGYALDFEARISVYLSGLVLFDFKICNSKAATHSGGFWELGDPGSSYFSGLKISFDCPSITQYAFSRERGVPYESVESQGSYSIYQESSGGEHWNCTNHINKDGRVPLTFSGYRLTNADQNVVEGARAEPSLFIVSNGLSCEVAVKQFWQNFPKSINCKHESLEIGLFPEEFPDEFELQGGESKTHTVVFDFSCRELSQAGRARVFLDSPLEVLVPTCQFAKASVLPMFQSLDECDPDLQEYIDYGVNGESNFFAKRERIDEFGWRNFGDVFADHESLYHKGNFPLISHYNNQYDTLYGFLRQYFLTGNIAWFELARDQAAHIVDIDIYHTVADRPEYNHGLFWHTDHYLDAHNSSHRTFSRKHMETDHVEQSGGGPGTEHCYSMGLGYMYLFSGDEKYKDAVLGMNQWITNLLDGPSTVFGTLFKFLKQDLKQIMAVLKRQPVYRFRYPLTRATGNFINSYIDAWMVTSDQAYLDKVYKIILDTVHPEEDLALRNLSDIEKGWSYVIFLQSVCRYMQIKESMSQYDEHYEYGKRVLILFARWMAKNEYPYLEKPEVLVYPNHTWTAQDVRKVSILYFCARYVEKGEAGHFIAKADYIKRYILDAASSTHESRYARFMAILMQSPVNKAKYSDLVSDPVDIKLKSYKIGIAGILARLVSKLFYRLVRLKVKDELAWIRNRVKS